MSEERQDVVIADEATAPRWVGIVVVALAVVSLVALGAGWTASTRSKQLEQSLAAQTQQSKQNDVVISQRLAKAEDTNAQLEGELSVVTDKMKLTEGELSKGPRAGQEDQGRRRQGIVGDAEPDQRAARDQGQHG